MGSWKPNNSGQAEWLRSSEGLRAGLETVVDKIKEAAEATAPVGPPGDPHRGQYKESFRSDVSVGKPVKGTERLIGHVYNDAPHAAAVEYGRGGRSADPGDHPHYTLTRAIDAAREL